MSDYSIVQDGEGNPVRVPRIDVSTTRPQRPPFIALGGRLRSGKDTVADYLVARYDFSKVGMSDALHQQLMTLNPIVSHWASATPKRVGPFWKRRTEIDLQTGLIRYASVINEYGYVEAKKNWPEIRGLQIKYGTEVGRELIDPEIWTKAAARRVEDIHSEKRGAVISGIRFPNEAQMVRDMGGILIWVARADAETHAEAAAHASENSVSASDFDIVLMNNGSLAELYVSVERLMTELKEKHA